jgi:DNA topoisomerase IB
MKHKNNYLIDGESIVFFGNPDNMENKFGRVAKIALNYDKYQQKLTDIISANLSFPVNKEYRLAVALKTILETGIRIGNEDSAEGFMTTYKVEGQEVLAKTYGLTTITDEHVKVVDGIVHFDFTGKKHVENVFHLSQELSKLIIPVINSGYNPLFGITESELTSFIKQNTSVNLSSKDFRTFRANVFGYLFAKDITPPQTKKERREAIKSVAEHVSEKLNNTVSVVKTSYLDKTLFEYFFPEIEE